MCVFETVGGESCSVPAEGGKLSPTPSEAVAGTAERVEKIHTATLLHRLAVPPIRHKKKADIFLLFNIPEPHLRINVVHLKMLA